jgi:hypothetical protein
MADDMHKPGNISWGDECGKGNGAAIDNGHKARSLRNGHLIFAPNSCINEKG